MLCVILVSIYLRTIVKKSSCLYFVCVCACVHACVCVVGEGEKLLFVACCFCFLFFLGGGIRRLESDDFQESKADKGTLLIRFQVPMLSPSVFRPSIGTSW